MAEEQPSLHIDTDWKKQAQEEKKRLTEQEQTKAATGAAASKSTPVETANMPRAGAGAGRGERGLPPATFTTLVQSMVTQVLFYLGELSTPGAEPAVNLDMAKHNIDMLGVIEEKTRGNLTPEEKSLLDGALYESRMRYVSIAQQIAMV